MAYYESIAFNAFNHPRNANVDRTDKTGAYGALNEKEAKDLLKAYGIPTVAEEAAADAAGAVAAARRLGFPVVLKGLGRSLLHKTEAGLVHLNLADAEAVARAAASVCAAAGEGLEGFLIQPMLAGRREFMAGLIRDPHFGPVVMFGVGGVLTEAIRDVVYRVAPLSEEDAGDMFAEIRAAKLLDAFRGEPAVDRAQLTRTLLGLALIGLEHPEISEIDINPLLVSRDGSVRAVDALVVRGASSVVATPPPVAPEAIGAVFYPRSIAFVGASGQFGKWGHTLLVNTVYGGFSGEIHLVNPRGGTIAGRPVYRSVREIPGAVDLAVVTVPAEKVLDLVPELAEKGIGKMLLITSGFGETGEGGKSLEKELVRLARAAGILILGPNTMGICNPHIRFYCTGSPAMPEPGSTAIVSQSGNMGVQLLSFAEQQGIGIRGFCGSGNEAMMTIEDYLDGLEIDDLTQTVMLYVESVKNGRRFFEAAQRVGRKKPIVLLKGGRSQAGNRAASSHTGAMTSDAVVFDAVCRQAGVVTVGEPMELLDLAAAFSALPLPQGNRVAIMTLGGGWGVITADLCSQFGLEVPELSPALLEKFDGMLPDYWSRSNPIDLVGERDPYLPLTVMEELLKWEGCDGVINLGILGRRFAAERLGRAVLKADPDHTAEFVALINQTLQKFEEEYIARIVRLMAQFEKPVFGVSLLPDKDNRTVYRVADGVHKGVFYPTPERAVKAFAKMHQYRKFRVRGSSAPAAR
jgi:acyl-CoA synthetase (NDP forming)